MEIKVLGLGCPKCRRLEELAREAAAELGVEATFTKVTRVEAIMAYEVLSTPALVIDEVVKSSGRIPPKDEIAAWIRAAQGLPQVSVSAEAPKNQQRPCPCAGNGFADLPPELRPRERKNSSLRQVTCPGCGLVYSTNRASDVCMECEKNGNVPHTSERT